MTINGINVNEIKGINETTIKAIVSRSVTAISEGFSAEEIKAIYLAVLSGKFDELEYEEYTSVRYLKSISLKSAVLANYKGLFPCLGYGYYYEPSDEGETNDEIVIPLALNAIFGYGAVKDEKNAVLITINRSKPYGYGDKTELLVNVENFYTGDYYEIPLDKFAELLANKKPDENNAKLL